jgi:hypothetical protein
MKLESLKSYRSAYQVLSSALILLVVILILIIGVLSYLLFSESQKGYRSIWIVDPKSKQAYRADQVLNEENPERVFEYKNHVRMFYKSWFEFDQFTYKANVDRGLQCLGNCGKGMLNDYKMQDVQRRLAEKNMKLMVEIDSIKIDMAQSPVTGIIFAKQIAESPAGSVTRFLNGKFRIIDLEGRSDENPHGCLIEDFTVFNNQIIQPNE